jgi:hypothetical protein
VALFQSPVAYSHIQTPTTTFIAPISRRSHAKGVREREESHTRLARPLAKSIAGVMLSPSDTIIEMLTGVKAEILL